jgi:hypothetical protein
MRKNPWSIGQTSGADNRLFIAICVIVAVIIIDTSIIKIYYFSISQTDFSWRTFLFVILSAICLGGQQLILRYVKLQNKESREYKGLHFRLLPQLVQGVQYGLTVFLVLIILQMIFTSRYNLVTLIVPICLSYAMATILMGILAARFLSWLRINKNSIVLLYGLASAVIALNSFTTLSYVTTIISQGPSYVFPHKGFVSPYIVVSSTTLLLNYVYVVSSIISFIVSWLATALLMRQYYPKVSTISYWLILLVPLTYFLLQFQPLFLNIASGLVKSQPVLFSILYTLIFAASKPVGGLIFAFAFWNIAKRVTHKGILKSYVIMLGLGFLLLFVSNQAIVLVSAPYPPFGFASITFMGLSSYLILVGISGAARSISNDAQLRSSIRKLTEEQYDLLGKIGLSQMEQEIQKKVMEATRRLSDTITNETGVESSLEEEDIKKYCSEVLAEIKRK